MNLYVFLEDCLKHWLNIFFEFQKSFLLLDREGRDSLRKIACTASLIALHVILLGRSLNNSKLVYGTNNSSSKIE